MANFCPQCGSPTDPKKPFCENCGAKLIIFKDPQPVQPEVPAAEPVSDGYVIPEESVSYPEPPQSLPDQSSDFSIPRPGAAQNTSVPGSDYSIPRPSTAENTTPSYVQLPQGTAQNTSAQYGSPSQAGNNAAPFIQPTQNTGSSVIPPKTPAKQSGKNLLPIIIGLAAVLIAAVFLLLRKKPEEPEVPTAAPSATPFAIKTPDVQIPTAPTVTEPSQTDVPQGIADFLRYNIPCDAEVNEDYSYPGMYDDGTDETAYGSLTFLSHAKVPISDDLIRQGKEENDMELEGYNIHQLQSQIDFTQADASDRGVLVTRYTGDYYDMNLLDQTFETLTDADGETYYRYEVDNNGKRQYIYYYVESEWTDWDSYLEYTENVYFFIPDGYDGVVRGFVNPKSDDPSVNNEPENNFLFRLS